MNRAALTWRSLAAAAGLACLMTFANLASGAGRIDNRHHRGRVKIVAAKLAPAVGLAAGDHDMRIFELKTGGRSQVKLLVRAPRSSLLVDPRLGVRLEIERCSKKWRQSRGVSSCRGRTTVVLADSPALGRHVVRKLARKGKNYLRVTLTLPQSAPNELQGLTAELLYTFS
jgi:hypothetical protein